MKDERRTPVAVLGATGMVGERLIEMLARHPWFDLIEAVASDRSAGDRLGDRLVPARGPLPDRVAALRLKAMDDALEAPLVLSALPAAVARDVEPRLAGEGRLVVSNASAFRTDPLVPLIVPEVNPDHLDLLDLQAPRWSGGLVTNPNCSVAGLVVPLKALHDAFGLESAVVTTLQAISGAGRPGPAAFDLVDNVIPFIGGEEEKLAAEPRKILGRVGDSGSEDADIRVSATCTRVPVLHGHMATVSARFREVPDPGRAIRVLRDFKTPLADLRLPTAPYRAIETTTADDRPQPRLDRHREGGMTVTVGRVRVCPVNHLSFVVLSHNLVRGAAGAALLNAELAVARGRVPGHGPPAGAAP